MKFSVTQARGQLLIVTKKTTSPAELGAMEAGVIQRTISTETPIFTQQIHLIYFELSLSITIHSMIHSTIHSPTLWRDSFRIIIIIILKTFSPVSIPICT